MTMTPIALASSGLIVFAILNYWRLSRATAQLRLLGDLIREERRPRGATPAQPPGAEGDRPLTAAPEGSRATGGQSLPASTGGSSMDGCRSLAAAAEGSGAIDADRPLPSLTVVVTARDEAASIERTVRALLAQDYEPLRIVVVDDRSTDGTAAILDRIAAEPEARKRLEVVHVTARPAGWLGKCHACRLGAERARGEWILFKDGDVTLVGERLLARTIGFAERARLDHIAVIPDMGPMPLLQTALVGVFGQVFLFFTRAHEMEEDRRRGGAGVGAFNLVRRAAYEAIGGHERLRMDPGDDVKLGQLLKESGARQRLYLGYGLVKCPWQRGTLATIRGLEKNAYSGCRYSVTMLILVTLVALVAALGPLAMFVVGLLALLRGAIAPAIVAFAPVATQGLLAAAAWRANRRKFPVPARVLLLYPIAILALLAALWNSAIRTIARGGIEWRGDFYPLAELKRGLVLPGAGREPVRRRERREGQGAA